MLGQRLSPDERINGADVLYTKKCGLGQRATTREMATQERYAPIDRLIVYAP